MGGAFIASGCDDSAVAGRVIALQRSPTKGAPTLRVDALELRRGRGIVDDHHYREDGAFDKTGRMVTLLAVEPIRALCGARRWDLDALALRRNVLTEGIALADLVGRRFLLGSATMTGTRIATPCLHIERQTQAGLVEALGAAAGLRAAIEEDGVVRRGDPVTPCDAPR